MIGVIEKKLEVEGGVNVMDMVLPEGADPNDPLNKGYFLVHVAIVGLIFYIIIFMVCTQR